MNPHFRHGENPPSSNLRRAYARLDHIEAAQASTTLLVAFDLVDAQWLDAQGQDPLLDLDHPFRCELAWAYRKKQKIHPNAHNPFESMPTYRLEIEVSTGSRLYEAGLLPDPLEKSSFGALTGALEKSWFEFDVEPRRQVGFEPANLYISLFANPIRVYVQGKLPSSRKSKSLSGIFSLGQLPALSPAQFEAMLTNKNADYLAVYDVGQGYANGPDNKHGGTNARHPTPLGMSIHNGADWDHQLWDFQFPGECLAFGDVLATCEHTPGTYRSGALAGWDGPPGSYIAPCGGGQCKTPLDQG